MKGSFNVLNRWTLSRVTMIHVFLDSSIYRQDPLRKSAAFQALARMGNADEIALHIPYFVKHEFLTGDDELLYGGCTAIGGLF